MSDGGQLTYESIDGVAVLTIDRPNKKNALSRAMAESLAQAWIKFDEGNDRVALLKGAGADFTAGIDVGDAPAEPSWAPNLGVATSKPIIVAIDGWCIGAGMMLLQQADLAVAAHTAKFRYPEAKFGLSRGMAAGLATKVPHKIAMEILLIGRVHTPEEFARAGLLNAVVDSDQLESTAMAWAREIASADQDVVRYLKQGVLDTVPRGPGEHAAHTVWEIEQLPGNRRLKAGGLSVDDLKGASR
ncbi:enoyl-CoA hydratase/isomerase family protein [Streptomyces sp. NPDC046805]|uniref:enoyl-CoA hydratase/isomerase family protein n=1 Tax=Streptomyces sp. NPDC046805 TaxID=3155134 RepID=UPI0033D56A5F